MSVATSGGSRPLADPSTDEYLLSDHAARELRAPAGGLRGVLAAHLAQRCLSVRAFAESASIPYPMVLGIVNKGSLPRSAEHRQALRSALGATPEAWAGLIAASQRAPVDLGGSAPTLGQLVLRLLLAQGHTEQSFASEAKLPYATILGVTRRGAIPRDDALAMIGSALGLSSEDIERAKERSHCARREGAPPVPDPTTQSLAQLVAGAARRAGQSVGAFAKAHELPYFAIMRLVATGQPPSEAELLARLADSLGLNETVFAATLARSRSHPEPANADHGDDSAATPLQVALKSVITKKGLTMKAFAELSELSVLTATRLVKHGALPSRTTTHQKLRALLDLDDSEYQSLVRQSKAEKMPTEALTDEEFQHKETEEIAADDHHPHALAPRGADTIDPEILAMIIKLDAAKRRALKDYLRGL